MKLIVAGMIIMLVQCSFAAPTPSPRSKASRSKASRPAAVIDIGGTDLAGREREAMVRTKQKLQELNDRLTSATTKDLDTVEYARLFREFAEQIGAAQGSKYWEDEPQVMLNKPREPTERAIELMMKEQNPESIPQVRRPGAGQAGQAMQLQASGGPQQSPGPVAATPASGEATDPDALTVAPIMGTPRRQDMRTPASDVEREYFRSQLLKRLGPQKTENNEAQPEELNPGPTPAQ